eukprot:CAMPEP_0174750048 /NCGR_PEP_ID=MMETSP1094-20130205/96949_1 /TAXON_ID=156173 /ORGANISM="Chrysochromulina brevifilum, Strain UTEX LB 985" /LENGTH=163 /DNA_ID=CAMNT_0015955345 /DNA_START=251 /DNA_END=738 /DNA_ORIENTATION=-
MASKGWAEAKEHASALAPNTREEERHPQRNASPSPPTPARPASASAEQSRVHSLRSTLTPASSAGSHCQPVIQTCTDSRVVSPSVGPCRASGRPLSAMVPSMTASSITLHVRQSKLSHAHAHEAHRRMISLSSPSLLAPVAGPVSTSGSCTSPGLITCSAVAT